MVKLKADGTTGKVAIYTGSNDLPFDNPLGNLSRVLFHSDLDYPAIIGTFSGTTVFPARGQVAYVATFHNMFAHGRPGIPLVFGRITNLTGTPALAGSVPVQSNAWGFGRFATLGANASNVILHEQIATGSADPDLDTSGFNSANSFGAIAISWQVYLTDTILE